MPWVPITDPMFKETYGENAPTILSIFGGQEGLKVFEQPNSVSVFTLRPTNENDQLDRITTLGSFAAAGPGRCLMPKDYRPLLAALQEPQNYGDQFLGVTRADFGFKIVSGTNVIDIAFDLETPSVTVGNLQQKHDDRRAVSLDLITMACGIAQQYLKPETDYSKRIGRKRSNNDLQLTK